MNAESMLLTANHTGNKSLFATELKFIIQNLKSDKNWLEHEQTSLQLIKRKQ